jgi:UDP-3-O-[3-hydroxymyristoyl] glucosamine N-acyltransferase
MQFEQPLPLQYFVEKYGLTVMGNKDIMVTGINEIHKVVHGNITFVDAEKYYAKSVNSAASVIIIDKMTDFPEGKALMICAEPFDVYNQIVLDFRPFRPLERDNPPRINTGVNTIIEPGVIIGHNVKIGDNVYIQAGSYIGNDTQIGDNVIIQAGALIGTDAFYFKKTNNKYIKWNSCGRVVIHDDVVIGAGCTINKGVSGDTIIGEGTKLDSQIHIGHGAVLGKNCLLAAQVGVAGKTIVGDNVVMYGQVGIAQNLTIGDNAVILAKSGVSKNLEGNKVYFGAPAEEAREKYKEIAKLRMLAKEEMSGMNNL